MLYASKLDVPVTVHRVKFLIIKPTRCANFLNLFLEKFADNCEQLSANLYDIFHCCMYRKKTPANGQRNCPKHVDFHSKNKLEKLALLVGFIIRKNF
jgi:hypothetical protein